MKLFLLIAFSFSGAAALIYEVAWTRALSLILGSTTYALSTMLSTFMAGLALGGIIGGRIADRAKNLPMVFGLTELMIGVFGLITIPLIHAFSPLYLWVYQTFHASATAFFVAQFLFCAGIMMIPTTLMGITFPVVSKSVTLSLEDIGTSVGKAYSYNTLGAILGSFGAGFILIPLIGVTMATVTAAGLNLIVGAAMMVHAGITVKKAVVLVCIVSLAGFLGIAGALSHDEWNANYYNAVRTESNELYRASMANNTVLFNKDYREGRVKLWLNNAAGLLVIEVGGKVEGTGPADLPNALLLAYLPIASHADPRSFLNIGLGTGITLAAARDNVPDISLVEINEGVLEAISTFGPRGLLNGIDVTVNDARNFLLLTEKKYDIISSEPSYPTGASTGNLFTKEFYATAASRLNEGGIFCQWLPYYMLGNEDVTMMLKTFGSVFGHVYLWKLPDAGDLILVGSLDPFRYGPEEITARVGQMNTSGTELPFVLSRTPGQIGEIVGKKDDIPLNTDDRPILEFHAALNLLNPPQ